MGATARGRKVIKKPKKKNPSSETTPFMRKCEEKKIRAAVSAKADERG